MTPITEYAESAIKRLNLPGEILAGELKLSVTGGKRALLENHRGILSFDREQIILATQKGRVQLRGENLYLAEMCEDWLVVCGKIRMMEWEE